MTRPTALIAAKDSLDAVRVEHSAVEAKLTKAVKKYRDLFGKYAMEEFNAATDKLAHILNAEFANVNQTHHNATGKYMWDTYGVMLNGVNSITGQRLIQLTFRSNNEGNHNAKMCELIEAALPHMIPYTADMTDWHGRKVDKELVGFCRFGLLSDNDSSYGITHVHFSHDKRVLVSFTRYGRTTYEPVRDYAAGIAHLVNNHSYGDDRVPDVW